MVEQANGEATRQKRQHLRHSGVAVRDLVQHGHLLQGTAILCDWCIAIGPQPLRLVAIVANLPIRQVLIPLVLPLILLGTISNTILNSLI